MIEMVILLIVAVYAMPIFGGYLALAGTKEQKPLGGALFVVGIIVWIMMGIA